MRVMKITLLSLLGAVFATTATPAQIPTPPTQLDNSEVRISYAELKRLLVAARPIGEVIPESPPPLPAALLSTIYHVDGQSDTITAEMQVQTFAEGWQSVALAGSSLGAVQIEPPDARLVVWQDQLSLLTDQPGTSQVTLFFPFTQPFTTTLAPSAVAAIEVKALPEGRWLHLRHDSKDIEVKQPGRVALPANGGEITLAWAGSSQPAALTSVSDEAILTAATYTTQVVPDGSVLTEGILTVRHDPPLQISLTLPPESQLLQCHVNGELIRPAIQNGMTLEIPLDESASENGESEIGLSFTATLPALQPTEGELDLALPQTPLFARQIDWNVQLPAGFDLTSSGNVDSVAAQTDSTNGLHLRKSLCRNQQPEARITYRKRSSN